MTNRPGLLAGGLLTSALLLSCGGGSTGTDLDSGVNKTYLSVEASDADGDALHYQWRVTSGSIDNRDAKETVWTMPDGPGLHFAYVIVSDGKGGWVEQQYAVSSDRLGTTALTPAPIDRAASQVMGSEGTQMRLRFQAPGPLNFADPAGGKTERLVFVPDIQVRVVAVDAMDNPVGAPVFTGKTNAFGDVDLPKLQPLASYRVDCATHAGTLLTDCSMLPRLTPGALAELLYESPDRNAARNLRLFGHVALADGAVCGTENAFFSVDTAATVQLQLADGTPVSDAVRVNRYGDYAVDGAVAVDAQVRLDVRCEGYAAKLTVPPSPDPAGYLATTPIELSHVIANARPRIVKMVANGGDGNIRGRMIVPGAGTGSNTQPGADHFLTYKGRDTKLSACLYYQALGAVGGCDAQGNMQAPITLSDWIRKNGFGSSADVAATYINKRDLNLVRRMTATQSAGRIAFYVCNSPGPDGASLAEVDDVVDIGLGEENRVACVAMEYSSVPGANNDLPFTQFYTFGPTGSLLASINLDGRGEKYMPGSCVACHGGSTYNGRFPEQSTASPYLGSRFLPFDTGNFLFSSRSQYTEAAQSEAIYGLNQLVVGTEADPPTCSAADPTDCTPTTRLINGWYAASHVLDRTYIAPKWLAAEAAKPGAAAFYHEVVGTSCRTCHVALGSRFDWDSTILTPRPFGVTPTRDPQLQACGGQADVALNATMPNALIASDLLLQRATGDAALALLMETFLGCSAPRPDPVYPKR